MADAVAGARVSALFPFPRNDRFSEWLQTPVPLESRHPRFDIRRAVPAEFDRIYDLVDDAFGIKRPRAHYDWLYRRNPHGFARCWLAFDRASGALVSSSGSWPWPIARGTERVEGAQDGDTVVAPAWQRQGIDAARSLAWRSHPWRKTTVVLSWPNPKARAAGVKRGRGRQIVGPVPKAVLVLNARSYLTEQRWPALLSAAGGAAADATFGAWRKIVLHNGGGLNVEPIRRFDSSVDEVTGRCMSWNGYWSPHDADFLNWRYLEHPVAQHLAFALVERGELAGYYVLRVDGARGWLSEFVTATAPRAYASTLLLHAIGSASRAGCTHLFFSAPPRWRHWRFMRTAGFLPVPSGIYLWTASELPDVTQLAEWQWVPGDLDFL
ncbi:MAG TPA: hypothetical protein VEJ86_10960 [Candidatus Binataceae bacterium]|nr:hypothetical protein [Candidatus Binataceae bacterium]